MGHGVIAGRIRIGQELHGLQQSVRGSVEYLQIAVGTVGNKDSVNVGAVYHRMSDADSLDAVYKIAGANIVDFDGFMIFRDDEEAIVFQVGCQVVEVVLNADHARRGQILGELTRRNVGLAAANIRKLDGLDQFEWRPIFGKYEISRHWPRSDSECGNPEEIPLVRTHPSLPPVKNST